MYGSAADVVRDSAVSKPFFYNYTFNVLY